MSASMFPARAGMSRARKYGGEGPLDVPRASGDEPAMPGKIKDALGCSPRERG